MSNVSKTSTLDYSYPHLYIEKQSHFRQASSHRSLIGRLISCKFLATLHKSVSFHFSIKVVTVGTQLSQYCLNWRIKSTIRGVGVCLRNGQAWTGKRSLYFLTWICCANWRVIEQADNDHENERACLQKIPSATILRGKTEVGRITVMRQPVLCYHPEILRAYFRATYSR